jgi:ATP synthase protein I
MVDPSDDARLKALDARIAAAKQAQAPKPHVEEHYSQAHLAWRMVIELVAGLGIGVAIGYGLDWLLGTGPWLMVLFMGLGFVAGVKTMIRSARDLQEKALAGAERQTQAAASADGNEKD